MKRMMILILIFALLLSGCASRAEVAAPEPEVLTPGYVPEEIPLPDWLSGSRWLYWDFCGDRIYLCGYDSDGTPALGYYNTTAGAYQRFACALPGAGEISACAEGVWLLCSETDRSAGEKTWTLFSCSPEGENAQSAVIPFYGGEGENSEGHNLYSEFSGPVALGAERALIFDGTGAYLLDRAAQVLGRPELDALRGGNRFTAGTQSWYGSWSETEGTVLRPFDPAALTLGEGFACDVYGVYESARGRLLCGMEGGVCELDLATGETRLLFRSLDTVLSAADLPLQGVLENSEGNFYYVTSGHIVRIRPTMVKERIPLTLLIFGDRSDWRTEEFVSRGDPRLLLTDDLMDAIIRFNNTEPDYRVELKTVCYETESERDRFLVELVTGGGVDLIDTSLLPERALDSRMLIDMLPYLDADETISRDDFVPALLQAMQRSGGLYEFTCRFALLGAVTGERSEDLTMNYVNRWAADNPERAALDLGWPGGREALRDRLCRLATAAFIDWDAGTCCFDDGRFAAWLEFLRTVPLEAERERPGLVLLSDNVCGEGIYSLQQSYGEAFRFTAFPEEGACWARADGQGTDRAARIGIPAGSGHPEGAWRFVRTLARSLGREDFWFGVPPLRENVERTLRSLSTAPAKDYGEDPNIYLHPVFTAAQAESLRALIYDTERMARDDEALLQILRQEADAVLSGQRSAQTAATNVQSRVSLYVAEQG